MQKESLNRGGSDFLILTAKLSLYFNCNEDYYLFLRHCKHTTNKGILKIMGYDNNMTIKNIFL